MQIFHFAVAYGNSVSLIIHAYLFEGKYNFKKESGKVTNKTMKENAHSYTGAVNFYNAKAPKRCWGHFLKFYKDYL